MGYYYGRGERRNILHESPENVAFRNCYLRRRFENLQGGNKVPTKPEVFLDESYCHLHHITGHTWVPSHGIVYEPGHGPLIIIFGAIIVMCNGNTNKLFDEIIPNSLLLWDPSIKPPSSRGRKRKNAEGWIIFPMSFETPILLQTKLIIMVILRLKYLKIFLINFVPMLRNVMDQLIFTWMVLGITNVELSKCQHQTRKRI